MTDPKEKTKLDDDALDEVAGGGFVYYKWNESQLNSDMETPGLGSASVETDSRRQNGTDVQNGWM